MRNKSLAKGGLCLRTVFFILCSLCIQQAWGQVVASFTASTTSGCAPLVVNFTNTSTGATSYSWNLGNTNTSFLQNASTSYPTPGTYTVTLTATGSSGSNTTTLQIVVNPPPVISFSATDTQVCKGVPVTFNNTTNLVATGTGTYSWNFGDGNTSTAQNPSHPFVTPGYYSITQTATNSNGCTASLVSANYIHVLAGPTALFATSNTAFCRPPAQVTFTDASTGSAPLSYAWNFGDFFTSPSASPTHSYSTTGSFTVKEVVTDSYGCKDSMVVPNDVTVQNIVATMNVPDTACENQTLLFQNTSIGPGVTSVWYFGDGSSSTNTNVLHTYYAGGSFTVKLIASAGGCTDSATKVIYVRSAPAITITHTPAHPCPAPVNVQLSSNAPSGTTFLWSLGDGTTSNLANPSITYNKDSTFPVSLSATVNGCTYVLSDTIIIYHLIIHADSPFVAAGCSNTPFPFLLNAYDNPPFTSPYPYPPVSYTTNYGDGSAVSTQHLSHHAYTNPGQYNAIMTLTTVNGCTMADTVNVFIGQKPILDSVTLTPRTVCRRDTVYIQTYAHGQQPLNYTYSYITTLAGSEETGLNDTLIKHVFASSGPWQVVVKVSNYGCPSDSDTFNVTVNSPSTSILANNSCRQPLSVSFNNNSIGVTSSEWYFGDGDSSSVFAPSHTYPATGAYYAQFTAYNSTSGCRDTATSLINILNFKPKIITPDTAVCQRGILNFTASYNSPNPPPQNYGWYIGGLLGSSTTQFSYPFNITGYTTVTLVEQDYNNCYDTTYQKILVAQPIAGFKASPTNICVPATVVFTDTSYYISGTYPVSHTWLFGDGTTGTTPNITEPHLYTTAGSFYVKEIVTDNIGCKDSIYYLNVVNTHKPTATFAVANPNRCAGDTITFINTSAATLQSQYWSFGDGTTSTAATPVHSYSATGTYSVTLAITDVTGCSDTVTKTAYIGISKPHAAFAVNNGSGVCVPLIVQFTNTSSNGASYAWTFGNTSTSVAPNPTTSYTIPGSYNVQLITADAHGCKDTAYGHVTLYGYSGSFTYSPLAGCPPLNVNFTASITGIPSLTWDFSDGTVTTPSANTTTTHTYTTPGKYVPKLVLIDSAGCHTSSYGTDTIKVDKVHAGFTETGAICMYDTVHFKDTSSGLFFPANRWLWLTGDGASSTAQNPLHNYHTPGTFSVTLIASDASGCKDTAINTITVHSLPTITTTGDTTICPGDSAHVSALGGVSYTWMQSAVVQCSTCNPTYITPLAPGYYTVTGTDSFGCKNKDSVKITFTYKTVSFAGPGGQICTGQSITLSDSGAQVYNWSPANGLSDSHSPNPIASPTGSTTYLAIAKTASCIPDTNFVNVIVNPLPKVTALGGTTVTAGSKVNLQAYGPNIISFLWDHADLLNCDNCTDPIATMQQTTQFNVTATNQYGCQDSAHVIIDVLCDKSQVFIPNTFTPNGDGQNDIFYPRGIGIKVVKSFRIYNRWGQLVFERDDIQLNDEHSGWDGTFNGAKPVADTYVYAMDAICDNGSLIDWKGDVTLIR